jgi:uncharacterized OB-fold protein
MATTRPVRNLDPYAEAFWEFTKDQELRLQRCSECAKFRFPPGPACDQCLSDSFEWVQVSGKGNLLSWTTFRRGYFAEYPPPHTNIVVELEEGPLFVSYPIGVDPSDLKLDMAMELRWEESEDKFGEYQLPLFVPARVTSA